MLACDLTGIINSEALSPPRCSKYLADAKNHTLELDAMLEMLEVRLFSIELLDNI